MLCTHIVIGCKLQKICFILFHLPLLSCAYSLIVVTPVESLCMHTCLCVRYHGQTCLEALSDEFPCSLDYFLFWRAPAPSPGPTPTGSGYRSVNGKECVSLGVGRVLNTPLMSLFSCLGVRVVFLQFILC